MNEGGPSEIGAVLAGGNRRPTHDRAVYFKNARRDFLAHLLKRGVGPGGMKFFDDLCDGVADPRDFAQSILEDHLLQREA